MPQNSDREDEEMMALLPSDIWFNGACNIPFHIGGILLYLINTAISQSGIPHVFDEIVCRASRLSGYFKDLSIYTFLKSRFRGHGLLNKIGFALLGSNVSGLTVKDESSTIEVFIAYCTKLMDKNKILILIVIWLLLAGRVEGGPVRENDTAVGHDRSLFTTFPLPKSLWCQIPEKDIECPVGDYAFELKTENCQYECPSWEQIICMNSEQGMVFFCIPNNTTCSQGIGWNVEHIDSTDVVVKESSCPEGYYQEEPSKCHNACKTRHLSLEIIPFQFKIFSKGNHSHPTKLMCDYTAGYYNANNKSYIRYDGNFAYYYQDFCTHINISNPCSNGQMPLYNGTCVDKCSTGYERDETDFKCKALKDNRSDRNPKTSFVTPAGQDKVTTSERNTDNSVDVDSSEGLEKLPLLRTEEVSGGHIAYLCLGVIVIVIVLGTATMSVIFPASFTRDKVVPEDGSSANADNVKTKTKPSGEEFKKKQDNTLTQPVLDNLNAQMQYVGALMINGVIGGTVFRVGTRYVMTASHVIRPVVYDGVSKVLDLQRLRSEHIYVNFNEAIGILPRVVCYLNCCFYHEELDVAVLELSNLSGLPGKMLLCKGDTNLEIENVSVIGYGNPKQQFKKHLDPLCEVVPQHGREIRLAHRYLRKNKKKMKKMLSNPKTVDDGYQGYDDEKNIIFHGFLEHGASGGPLLVCNDPHSVKVIGVLTHGIPECFYNLPDNEQNKFPKNFRFHLACRMPMIYNAIYAENEALAKDLFGGH